ncbi:MAG: hypothetical protein ACHQ6T_17135 [Myxococcota bacterium]
MTSERRPSIKATGFQSAADDLARLIETGRLSRDELEARLPVADFAYLAKSLAASSWVPIETYERVAAILVELEGNGDFPSYFRGRGRRAAARLHKAGLYRQFDASVEAWGKRAGKVATTMSAVLYNFTRWTFAVKEDERAFQIIVEDALEFPDSLRFVGEGFIEYVSRHFSKERTVSLTSEREARGRIVYTIRVE